MIQQLKERAQSSVKLADLERDLLLEKLNNVAIIDNFPEEFLMNDNEFTEKSTNL